MRLVTGLGKNRLLGFVGQVILRKQELVEGLMIEVGSVKELTAGECDGSP